MFSCKNVNVVFLKITFIDTGRKFYPYSLHTLVVIEPKCDSIDLSATTLFTRINIHSYDPVLNLHTGHTKA